MSNLYGHRKYNCQECHIHHLEWFYQHCLMSYSEEKSPKICLAIQSRILCEMHLGKIACLPIKEKIGCCLFPPYIPESKGEIYKEMLLCNLLINNWK